MNKGKISVSTQLEDTKSLANAESKDRSSLLTKYKMMTTDLENVREKLENENMRKSDSLKALSKAQAEIQLWKSRYETEGLGRVEPEPSFRLRSLKTRSWWILSLQKWQMLRSPRPG